MPKERYRVVGRIVAQGIPLGYLGDGIKIRRAHSTRRTRRPSHLRSSTSEEFEGGYLEGSPSEIMVTSNAIIEMRVRATDREDAVRVAHTRQIEPLVAGLRMLTGAPVWVEVSAVDREDPDGNIVDTGWSVWSDTAMMSNLGPMLRLGQWGANTLERLYTAIRQDGVAGQAATDLVSATAMSWTAGGRDAEGAAAALKLFLVIERVATKVAAKRPVEPTDEAVARQVVDQLRRGLRTTSMSQAERIIVNAAKELEKARGRRLATDIRFTCERLEIWERHRDTALELNQLRNQTLAHPGRPIERHQLRTLLVDAERASDAFLGAYVRNLVALDGV